MRIPGELRRRIRFQKLVLRSCKNCINGIYVDGGYKCTVYPGIFYEFCDEFKYICQDWDK